MPTMADDQELDLDSIIGRLLEGEEKECLWCDYINSPLSLTFHQSVDMISVLTPYWIPSSLSTLSSLLFSLSSTRNTDHQDSSVGRERGERVVSQGKRHLLGPAHSSGTRGTSEDMWWVTVQYVWCESLYSMRSECMPVYSCSWAC